MSKIKILINTDSATLHSGLAETTRNIFIPLLERYPNKYEIHQIGWFHVQPREQVPWPIYPTKIERHPDGRVSINENDKYAQETFGPIVQQVNPDIVFAYSDLWTFDHILNSPLRNTYRLAVYYTIDGQPYYGHLEEDGSTTWGKMLARADEVVVLSHFGEQCLHACCPELKDKELHVRYHPLNLKMYPEFSENDILQMRAHVLPRALDPAKVFICGWMGRNQFRKQNYKLWELGHYMVYGDYIECHKCGRITLKEYNHSTRKPKEPGSLSYLDMMLYYDRGYDYSYCWHCKGSDISHGVPDNDFYLWFHMSKNDPGYNCDLHDRMWGLQNRILYSNNLNGITGISREDVVRLLACWDVMYYPSGGEGFGNPAFECIATGTPIVYSNYSSHAEFCWYGGLPLRGGYVPELYHGIMRCAVDTGDAVANMLALRRNKVLRKSLGASGRRHAFQFSTTHMVPAWDDLFTNMMKKPLPVNSDKIYATAL